MKKLLQTTVLALAMPLGAAAADFQDGDFYFNILEGGTTVELSSTTSIPEPYRFATGVESDAAVSFSARWNDDKALDNLTEMVYIPDGATVDKVLRAVLKGDNRFYAMQYNGKKSPTASTPTATAPEASTWTAQKNS